MSTDDEQSLSDKNDAGASALALAITGLNRHPEGIPITPDTVRALIRDKTIDKDVHMGFLAMLAMKASITGNDPKMVAAFRAGTKEMLKPGNHIRKQRGRRRRKIA